MPFVVKDRKPPEPWDEVRRKSRHRWMLPLLRMDWLFERIAFHLSHWSFLEVLEYAGVQWAVGRGAVQIPSTEQWNEAIRRAAPVGK